VLELEGVDAVFEALQLFRIKKKEIKNFIY